VHGSRPNLGTSHLAGGPEVTLRKPTGGRQSSSSTCPSGGPDLFFFSHPHCSIQPPHTANGFRPATIGAASRRDRPRGSHHPLRSRRMYPRDARRARRAGPVRKAATGRAHTRVRGRAARLRFDPPSGGSGARIPAAPWARQHGRADWVQEPTSCGVRAVLACAKRPSRGSVPTYPGRSWSGRPPRCWSNTPDNDRRPEPRPLTRHVYVDGCTDTDPALDRLLGHRRRWAHVRSGLRRCPEVRPRSRSAVVTRTLCRIQPSG